MENFVNNNSNCFANLYKYEFVGFFYASKLLKRIYYFCNSFIDSLLLSCEVDGKMKFIYLHGEIGKSPAVDVVKVLIAFITGLRF